MADKQEILLEAGTNEFNIVEFNVGGDAFGINVAKVKEILQYTDIRTMPHSHPHIEGVFQDRDSVITVVDLAGYLGLPKLPSSGRELLIICSFNNMNIAFHVHSVAGIDRVPWSDVTKPDPTIYAGEGIVTGIVSLENRIIALLDFEKIVADINPALSIKVSDIEKLGVRERNGLPILIAEDSQMFAALIVESLHKAGYENVVKTDNGQEAWDYLCKLRDGNAVEDGISLVITDIEMPRLDGHRLTKLIREDPVLKHLPVVIFSSLINDEMRLKGEQVGADAQLTKTEITKLVSVVDSLTAK